MTDNARIVREVIEFREKWFPHPQTEAALTALAALETELATAKAREAELTKALAEVQADLARAREEERERIIGILTTKRPVFDTADMIPIRCNELWLRAALAPEQKGE